MTGRGAWKRFRLAAVVFGAALIAAGPAHAGKYVRPADPFTFANPAFCTPELVRDFGLSRLPPVREGPTTGDIPFGPKSVSLNGSNANRILPVGSGFGYKLLSESYSGRTPLHWTVRTRMVDMDRKGRRERVVDRKKIKIRAISNGSNPDLHLGPLRRPGFYLYEIEFLNRNGKLLGRFGRYLKIFARSYWKARLGLSKQVAAPGERVLSRVENLGTEMVAFGEEFYVHRLEGESWVPVLDATQGTWLRWLDGAGPGSSGRCSAWRIPTDFPLGQYRIVKEVGSRPWPSANNRARYLVAPISVAVVQQPLFRVPDRAAPPLAP